MQNRPPRETGKHSSDKNRKQARRQQIFRAQDWNLRGM
jgi:hypothetical protein